MPKENLTTAQLTEQIQNFEKRRGGNAALLAEQQRKHNALLAERDTLTYTSVEAKESEAVSHPAVQRIQDELETIEKKLAVALPKEEAAVLVKKRTHLERQLQNLEIALDARLNEVEKIEKIFESGFDAYAISNHDQDTDVAIQILSLMQKGGKHIVAGKEENIGYAKTIANVSHTPQVWLQIDRGMKNDVDISVDEIGNVIVTVDHHGNGQKITPTSAADALYFFLKSRGYSLPPIELFGPKGSNPVSIHEETFERFLHFINVKDNLLYNQTRDDLQRIYPREYQLLKQKLTPEETALIFSPNNSVQKLKNEYPKVYEKLTKKTAAEDKILSEYELDYFFTPTYNLDQLKEVYPISLPGIMHMLPQKEVLRIYALLDGDPYRRFTDEELQIKIRDNGGSTHTLRRLVNNHKERYVEPAIEMFEFLEKKSLERWGGISDQFGPTLLVTGRALGIPSHIAYAKGYTTLALLDPIKKSLHIFSHSPNLAIAYERIAAQIPGAVFPRGNMIIVPEGMLTMSWHKNDNGPEIVLTMEQLQQEIADILGLHKETVAEPVYSAGDVGVRTGEDVSFDMPKGKDTPYSHIPPLRPGDTEQAKPDKGDGRMMPDAKPTTFSGEPPKQTIDPALLFELPKIENSAKDIGDEIDNLFNEIDERHK